LKWMSAGNVISGGTPDLVLVRDAAGTLAQRNSTNAQTFRLYNTYTDASNYEYFSFGFASNELRINTQAAGTGSNRNIYFQHGGSTQASVRNNGLYATNFRGVNGSDAETVTVAANDGTGNAGVLYMSNGFEFRWGDSFAGDTRLLRDAADALAMRRSTNAQAFRLYNTYTDASNYERLNITWNSALVGVGNICSIELDSAGTGSTRQMRVLFGSQLNLSGTNLYLQGADNYVDGRFAFRRDGSERTIASGAISVTKSFQTVDTEADAGTDDLDTITGGNDGSLVILRAADSARTIVVKDGTGNLQLAGDMTLDNAQDTITLIYESSLSAWLEVARSGNGA
jgi:hypothetical protein